MHVLYYFLYVFFFKQKTAYEMRISDWSSDVCSSDLRPQIYALCLLALHVHPDAERDRPHAFRPVRPASLHRDEPLRDYRFSRDPELLDRADRRFLASRPAFLLALRPARHPLEIGREHV